MVNLMFSYSEATFCGETLTSQDMEPSPSQFSEYPLALALSETLGFSPEAEDRPQKILDRIGR